MDNSTGSFFKAGAKLAGAFVCPVPSTLSLAQRLVVSAHGQRVENAYDARNAATVREKIRLELAKHLEREAARNDRVREQQDAASARVGAKLAAAVGKKWNTISLGYIDGLRVNFELAKRQHGERKQEQLLKEMEGITERLVASLLGGKSEVAREEDGPAKIPELRLLNTLGGTRPLRPYQQSSLRWLVHLTNHNLSGILADEMGLGKTVQTIAILVYFAEVRRDWGPHLIVVPTTVVMNWKAEFERWAPGLKVLTYMGSRAERAERRKGWTAEDAFHVCIVSYGTAVRDASKLRTKRWGFLVLDEAHVIKNFASLKWQTLFEFRSEFRLLLSGTPLQNSVMELWSLFHFLLPRASAFQSNTEFRDWFSNPMNDMVSGRRELHEETVRRLQALLRPFMLRRLKRDVESELPGKIEKVIMCQLSRRQRALYDDFLQLSDTQSKLRERGAVGGVLGVLLALRKVCNHPDLFEEHSVRSPFVTSRFPGEIAFIHVPRQVLMLNNRTGRRRFAHPICMNSSLVVDVNAGASSITESDNWLGCSGSFGEEDTSVVNWLSLALCFSSFFSAHSTSILERFWSGSPPTVGAFFKPAELRSTAQQKAAAWLLASQQADARNCQSRADFWERCCASRLFRMMVVLGSGGAFSCVRSFLRPLFQIVCPSRTQPDKWLWELPGGRIRAMRLIARSPRWCPRLEDRIRGMETAIPHLCVYVGKALCVTGGPVLHCSLPVLHFRPFRRLSRADLAPLLSICDLQPLRGERCFSATSFLRNLWPIHVRRSFRWPSRRLLIHDCGKLRVLENILKGLRRDGHRVLLFTQFNAMLDILERFLALIGVTYLRIDGGTKPESRQIYADSFNASERITCMILSTRSGGVGLNLTGADTVIFYDIDWNPTMDLQAQDRCHRIGQTRLVTIYRLVSEHTVEERILKKSRERKMLNNIVIRAGNFGAIGDVGTTGSGTSAAAEAGEAMNALSHRVSIRSFFHDFDEDAEVVSQMPDATEDELAQAMVAVEDREDAVALARARREVLAEEVAAQADVLESITSGGPADSSSRCEGLRNAVDKHRLLDVEQVLARSYERLHPTAARRHYDDLRLLFENMIDAEHFPRPPQ
jgi:SNF2 family DNA or RNA helicase